MKSFLFGLNGDPQTQTLAEYFDHVFLFDDFGQEWQFSVQSGAVTIHTGEVTLPLTKQDSIYIRGPSQARDREMEQAFCLFNDLVSSLANIQAGQKAILNKLTQLVEFGGPRSEIFSNLSLAWQKPSLTKSISNFKTDPLPLDPSETHLAPLPTLVQEKLNGHEIKVNVFFLETGVRFLGVEKSGDKFKSREINSTHVGFSELKKLATKINESSKLNYFDIDVFFNEDGSVDFLEWNNSVCSAPFEKQLEGVPSLALQVLLKGQPVVIGQSNDRVVQALRQSSATKNCPFFPVENFRQSANSWDFLESRGLLLLRRQNRWIKPSSLYMRMVHPEKGGALNAGLNDFYNALEWINVPVLGKMSQQFTNGSKPLQMSAVLNKSINAQVRMPKTVIQKGKFASWKDLINNTGEELIVKSMSGIRSVVVDQNTFQKWDLSSVAALPTLFQQKISGIDTRIHWVNGDTFGVEVPTKEGVDYRYCKTSPFQTADVPAPVAEFCAGLSETESNPMIGVDFLRLGSDYYCLESNPSPGWSWYYPAGSKISHSIAEVLNEKVS